MTKILDKSRKCIIIKTETVANVTKKEVFYMKNRKDPTCNGLKQTKKDIEHALRYFQRAVYGLRTIHNWMHEELNASTQLILNNAIITFNQVEQLYLVLRREYDKVGDLGIVTLRTGRLAEMELDYFKKQTEFMNATDEKEKLSLKRELIELELKIEFFKKMLFSDS